MKRRTRLFLSVAVGILVLGLGTGLVAYMGGFQNLAVLGSNAPAELAYIPTDTRIVAFADVRQIMASQLRQRLREWPQASGDAEAQFMQLTGINVDQDIDHVVATVTRDGDAGGDQPLVLARGRFDVGRIERLAQDHGATVGDHQGIRLLLAPNGQMSLAFLEADLIAVGAPSALRRAIDTKFANSGDVTDNAELMGLVRDIQDSQAWAVARFDALAAGRIPPAVAQQMPPINWFAVTGQIDSGIHGLVRAEAADEASAQNLREVIRGFIALGRMQASQQAGLSELINSLQLGGQGTTVSLAFSIPEEVITALGSLRAARQSRPVPPATEPAPEAAPARPSSPGL